jgi:hypothetical protein
MDTDKLSVEVVGFMIMEAWFVIKKQKGGGRVLFFAKKKKIRRNWRGGSCVML